MSECNICFNQINKYNMYYAKIDNPDERGVYHLHCLQKWLDTSNNGIMTQNKIIAYHIYISDDKVLTINIENKVQPSAPILNYTPQTYQHYSSQIHDNSIIQEHRVSVSQCENRECIGNNRYYYENQECIESNRYYHEDECRNRCRITICAIISIIFLIMAILTFIYVTGS